MEKLAAKHGIGLKNPGTMVDSKADDNDDGMQVVTSTKVTVDELAEMTSKMTIDKKYKKKAAAALNDKGVKIKSKAIKKDKDKTNERKKKRSKNSKQLKF